VSEDESERRDQRAALLQHRRDPHVEIAAGKQMVVVPALRAASKSMSLPR